MMPAIASVRELITLFPMSISFLSPTTPTAVVIFSMKRYYMSGKKDLSPLRTTSTTVNTEEARSLILHQKKEDILRIFSQTPLGAFLLSHGFIMKFVKFSITNTDCGVVHIYLEPSLHIITDTQCLRYFNLPCYEIFKRDCSCEELEYNWMKEQVINHGRQSSEIIVELRPSSQPPPLLLLPSQPTSSSASPCSSIYPTYSSLPPCMM